MSDPYSFKKRTHIFVQDDTLIYKNKAYSSYDISHIIILRRNKIKIYSNKKVISCCLLKEDNAARLLDWARNHAIVIWDKSIKY